MGSTATSSVRIRVWEFGCVYVCTNTGVRVWLCACVQVDRTRLVPGHTNMYTIYWYLNTYIHIYLLSFFLVRLNFIPASLSFWTLFFASEYRIQPLWYASVIACRNHSTCNMGFSSVWPGKAKVMWSVIVHLGTDRAARWNTLPSCSPEGRCAANLCEAACEVG